MIKSFNEYIEFIKESKIIDGAIMYFIGSSIRTYMHRIMEEIVIPVTEGKIKKLKLNYYKYFTEIVQIIITSYLLFILRKQVINLK